MGVNGFLMDPLIKAGKGAVLPLRRRTGLRSLLDAEGSIYRWVQGSLFRSYFPLCLPNLCNPHMKAGDYVLDLLEGAPGTKKIIMLLRHSKRDSFQGVPEHVRPAVEITPEGVRMAKEFGVSLNALVPGRQLFLGHTVARRCRMTAECIGQEYVPAGCVHMLEYHEEIGEPVVDLARFVDIREEFGWQPLMKKWLAGEIPPGVMQDPQRFSSNLISRLVSFPGMGDGDLFVVIAHDITLFPVIHSVFGVPVTAVDFLNGVVISAGRDTAEVRFADAEQSLKARLGLPVHD